MSTHTDLSTKSPAELRALAYDSQQRASSLQQALLETTDPATADHLLAQLGDLQQELNAIEQALGAARTDATARGVLLTVNDTGKATTRSDKGKATGLKATLRLRMAQVPTATYHLLDPQENPLLECELENEGRETLRVRVTSFIDGYSATAISTVEVASKKSQTIQQLPTLFPGRVRGLHELTRATLNMQVDVLGGDVQTHSTSPIWLLARNAATLAVRDPVSDKQTDLSRFLGAFVTPNAPAVMQFLRTVARHHPSGQLAGYQDDVEPQVRAIFAALKQDGDITYVNSIISFNPDAAANSQRVRLPRQCLAEHQANCIDGTLLFASLLEAASLNPALVFVPGHALVGWETIARSDRWDFLETTLLNAGSFEDAQAMGRRKVDYWQRQAEIAKNPLIFRQWSLRDLRAQDGITPLE